MDRIVTSRLVLRGLSPRDAGLLLDFEQTNREWLAPWEPLRDETFFTADRALGAIRSDAQAARRKTGFRWHLFLRDHPGVLVGSVAVTGIIGGAFQSAYLGYRLGREFVGQGLATEAVGAAAAYAFSTLGLHRLEANVMPRNAASRRLLARLGFVEEGLARRYLKIQGVWEDHLHHVLFSPEDR